MEGGRSSHSSEGPCFPDWEGALQRHLIPLLQTLEREAYESSIRLEQSSAANYPEKGSRAQGREVSLGRFSEEVYAFHLDMAVQTLFHYAMADFLLCRLQDEARRDIPPDQWAEWYLAPPTDKVYGPPVPINPQAAVELEGRSDVDTDLIPASVQREYGPPPLYQSVMAHIAKKLGPLPENEKNLVQNLIWHASPNVEQWLRAWIQFISALKNMPKERLVTERQKICKYLTDLQQRAYRALMLRANLLIDPPEAQSWGQRVRTLCSLTGIVSPLPPSAQAVVKIAARLAYDAQSTSGENGND